MLVVGFGTYDRSRHPRIGVLLDGLRAHQHTVLEVNRPLGFSTAERVHMLRHPSSAWRLVLRLLSRWVALVRASRGVRSGPAPDAIVVGYLGQFDVLLARILFRHRRIVLDQLIFGADTASDRKLGSPVRSLLLGWLDRLALRCADLIVLDTEDHRELLPRRRRHDAVVAMVGAGTEWFGARLQLQAEPLETADSQPISVIFYGLFTPLHGTATIAAALQLLADCDSISVTMVGTGQDYPAARAAAETNSRVRWIDWVQPDELPTLVAAHDVCLGIFGDSPKARRVVPTKAYQAAAAGCALITSDTPAARRVLGESALYINPGDAKGLAAALRLLASDPQLLHRYRSNLRAHADTHFTADAVTAELHARLSQ